MRTADNIIMAVLVAAFVVVVLFVAPAQQDYADMCEEGMKPTMDHLWDDAYWNEDGTFKKEFSNRPPSQKNH